MPMQLFLFTENVTMYNDKSRRTSSGSNFAWSTGHRGATLQDTNTNTNICHRIFSENLIYV